MLRSLTLVEIIGFLTVLLSFLSKIIGHPDQIKKNYRRKSTDGISVRFYILAFLSYCFLTLYGVLENDFFIALGQFLGILTTGTVLTQILLYRNNRSEIHENEN